MQVDQMSYWEFAACVTGYQKSQGVKTGGTKTMSDERLAELGIEGF